jgi:hypothetical protein
MKKKKFLEENGTGIILERCIYTPWKTSIVHSVCTLSIYPVQKTSLSTLQDWEDFTTTATTATESTTTMKLCTTLDNISNQ